MGAEEREMREKLEEGRKKGRRERGGGNGLEKGGREGQRVKRKEEMNRKKEPWKENHRGMDRWAGGG